MTSACGRLGGRNGPTYCLPARTVQRRGEGAGHWLVAYRKAEQQKYRAVLRRVKDTYRKRENEEAGVTLDGLLLLQTHCVDEPFQLCSVDISERKLNSVKPEDFKIFENVAYIDASINSLTLGSFSCFAALRELNLSLNGICNMTFDGASFPHLEVLDLSYNSLSPEAVVSLGRLPRLRALHLTGNRLRHLSPDVHSSNHDSTQLPSGGKDEKFEDLEVLMLDDNKLSSGVFHSLANFKRLKYLNLQGNHIAEIPFMQVTSSFKPAQISGEEEAHAEVNLNISEHLEVLRSFHTDSLEESSLPLPKLQFLNLAENKIAKEEALIAAALFPMLREIDICSNPLTTKRRVLPRGRVVEGDPPLLAHYLQERLGIKIKRKKTEAAARLPLKVYTDPKWKLEEDIPERSKRPLWMNAVCPTQTQVNKCEVAVKRATGAEGKNSSFVSKNTQHLFMTQAEDELEFEFDPSSEEKETAENKQERRSRHKQSTCYEMMMDVKASPDALKHVGVQTAVWMLEHTLRNLNVSRDSKPKLDSIQTPYRERKKKITVLPPLRAIKQPAERTDETFEKIKKKYINKSS